MGRVTVLNISNDIFLISNLTYKRRLNLENCKNYSSVSASVYYLKKVPSLFTTTINLHITQKTLIRYNDNAIKIKNQNK